MNDLDIRNTAVAVYRPACVSQTGVEQAMHESRELGCLSIEVEVPVADSATFRPMLERLGFVISGTASADNRVIKFKFLIRHCDNQGANPDLAVTPTMFPPSDVERAATAGFNLDRWLPEAVAARVRELQGPPRPVEDMAHINALAQAELAAARRRRAERIDAGSF